MMGLSIGHLVIATVVILLFGHRRLPELGHALGKGMGAFKQGLDGKDMDSPALEDERDPSRKILK